MVQTEVRPTAGGLAFGAASGSPTVTVADLGSFFTGDQWVAVASGAAVSLAVHALKAAARPVVNLSTGGLGVPVVSTIEDVFSAVMSVVAIVFPILVLGFLSLLGWAYAGLRRRRGRRQAARRLRLDPRPGGRNTGGRDGGRNTGGRDGGAG